MDLRQLRAVVTLAEEGHFGRAAERLHVVPSALSMQIRQLEGELGGPLFHRTSRHVALTDAGRALVEGARVVNEQADALREGVVRRLRGELGRVRIGFTGSQGVSGHMKDHVRDFHARYPAVELTLQEMGPEEQYEAIRQREIDVGYTAKVLPALPAPLRVHRYWPMEWHVLMAQDHALAAQRRVPAELLADQQFVFYGGQGVGRRQTHPLARMLGGETPRLTRANSVMAVLSHVAAGLGITFVPSFEAHTQPPGLVTRPVEVVAPDFELVLISHERLDSRSAQLFIDAIPGQPPA